MKTPTQFILAALATALFAAGSAAASEPQWLVIDNHHGAYLYLPRAAQAGTTIAFAGHAKGMGSTATTVKRTYSSPSAAKSGFREVATPHGTVSYFAPAE